MLLQGPSNVELMQLGVDIPSQKMTKQAQRLGAKRKGNFSERLWSGDNARAALTRLPQICQPTNRKNIRPKSRLTS